MKRGSWGFRCGDEGWVDNVNSKFCDLKGALVIDDQRLCFRKELCLGSFKGPGSEDSETLTTPLRVPRHALGVLLINPPIWNVRRVPHDNRLQKS